jgi:hypothetical protein
MKKPLLLLLLLLVGIYQVQATFVPTPGAKYNIVQHASKRVIGADGTQPCVQDINNRPNQSFEFVAVSGLTDTYYLVNEDGNYLNKLSTNAWTTVFEAAPNGQNSEWVVVGEQDTFRLQLTVNSKYMASDETGTGSALYCDKAVDNERGTFTVQEAVVVYEIFDLSIRNVRVQIEKDHKPYPITITCSGFWDPVKVLTPEGYTVSKSVFTPEEFLENEGKMGMDISSSAQVGDTSTIYFYIGEYGVDEIIFDSLQVATVEKQPRHFIKNNGNPLLVIGNHAESGTPALTTNEGKPSQQFILRPVNPGLVDSLYYIIQDEGYRYMRKVPSSGWSVDFGTASQEAIWKISPISENSDTVGLINTVTKKYLGADGLGAESRLYDDKAWVENPKTAPYTQWVIKEASQEAIPEVYEQPIGLGFNLEIESNYQSYPFRFKTSGIKETIHIVPTTGFTVDKSSFTPEEVKALEGKVTVRISTKLESGMDGNLYVSKGATAGETMLDTVNLLSVSVHPRFQILNGASETLVLGSHPDDSNPALTINKDTITQLFIVCKADVQLPDSLSSLTDSLYFIVQDGDYRMLAKDAANYWGTLWGVPSNEALWFLHPQDGGIYNIVNFVSGNSLGCDAISELGGDYLYCDKIFTPAPTAKPFCEWKLVSHALGMPAVSSSNLVITNNAGQLTLHGTKTGERVLVYNLSGRCVRQLTAASSETALNLTPGFYLVKVNNTVLKVVL